MIRSRHVQDFFDVSKDDIVTDISEDEEKLQHLEKLLQEWIECESHLPKNYDRGMLRNFVKGAKFNLDTTKRKLEGYFFAKYAYASIYQDRIPRDVLKTCQSMNIVRLPRLTQKGERICIVSLPSLDLDTEAFDVMMMIKLYFMLHDLTLTCTFPTGAEILIIDAANVTPRVVAQCLSSHFKNAVTVLRHAYAMRLSQLHVINCPTIAEAVIAVVRPLLPEKVRQRFIAHKKVDTLHDYLHLEELPSDYGGKLGSMKSYMEQWTGILQKNADWFQEQESVKIVGKPSNRINKFHCDIGVEGSFRQLNID